MRMLLILLLVLAPSCNNNTYEMAHEFEIEYELFNGLMKSVIAENEISSDIAAEIINSENVNVRYPKNIYYKDETGVLADHRHVAKTNIYIPASVSITDSTWKIIQKTEEMEKRWAIVKKMFPNIGWQYLTEGKTKVSRTYPWLDEVRNLGPNIDYTKVPQWELVVPRNNPEGESRCTNVYYDHDGLGFMISCVSPVGDNVFIGNMSVDLPLNDFFKEFVKLVNDSLDSCTFVFDSVGELIVGTNDIRSMKLCADINLRRSLSDFPELYNQVIDKSYCNNKMFNINLRGCVYNLICRPVEYVDGYMIKIFRK